MATGLSRRKPGWAGSLAESQRGTRLLIVGAFGLAIVIEVIFFYWARKGPPPHKTEFFFVEFVLILAGLIVLGALALLSGRSAAASIPLAFSVLAWHTGFELNVTNNAILVVTAIDVLIPVALLLALVGHWNERPGAAALQPLWLPLSVFAVFIVWGIILAFARADPWAAELENLKSFILYPPLALIVAWSIQTWRQLAITIVFFLMLCFERAVEGLRQGSAAATQAQLSHGAAFARINGNFASVNQYALYLLTGFLILAAFILLKRSWRLRLLLLVPTAVIGYAIILTLSRGSWLAGGICAALLAMLLGFRRALKFGAVALVVLAIAVTADHHLANIVLNRATTYTDSSTVERQQWTQMGVQVVKEFPLGAGWGAAFFETPSGPQTWPTGYPWYHDDYLQLATEIGIPGMLAFIWLLAAVLFVGYRAFRCAKTLTKRCAIAGLMAGVLAGCVQATLDQFFWLAAIAPFIWINAGLLLGAAMLARREAMEAQTGEAKMPDSVAA